MKLDDARAVCKDPALSSVGDLGEAAKRVEQELAEYDDVAQLVTQALELGKRMAYADAAAIVAGAGEQCPDNVKPLLSALADSLKDKGLAI